MNKAIERKINKIYKALFKKVFTTKTTSSMLRGGKGFAKAQIAKLQTSKQFDEFARKFSKELAKQGLRGTKGVWRKYFEAAKASGYIALQTSFSKYEYENMSAAVKHNFEMIKSIPSKFIEILEHKYVSTLIEQVAKGNLGRKSFQHQLEAHGHKNARVIARTEAAKLQTAIVENRATRLGSVAYEWLSSNDKRTRQSHKEMNGVVVFWQPPNGNKPLLDNMRGNAGEFPNCRCSPQPIVDVDDLDKYSYDVYDYRTDNVVSMSRKNLIEALERGQL